MINKPLLPYIIKKQNNVNYIKGTLRVNVIV